MAINKREAVRCAGAFLLAVVGMGASPAAAETLQLNDMESLSGPGAAVYQPQANAIQLAGEQINERGGITVGGKKYTLKITQQDDRTDTSAGVAVIQKILSEGSPSFILGGGTSSISAAYSPIVKDRDDVIIMVTASLLPGLTDNPAVYRPRIAINQYTDSIVSLISTKNWKRVAMAVDNKNAGLVNATGAIKDGLAAKGVAIVAEEEWSSGASQFSAQISAMSRTNPDVILLRGYPSDVTRAIKQARELGYAGPIVTNSGMSSKDVVDAQAANAMDKVSEIVTPVISDLILGDLNKAMAQKFEDAYQKRFGQPSGLLSVSAYDSVFILTRAMEKADTVTDVAAIKQALDNLKVEDVPELVEPIKPAEGGRIFDKHQSRFVTVVRGWDGNKLVPLEFIR